MVSTFLLGETFPLTVYLSRVPIIGGFGLSALAELNFNMTGLTFDLVAGEMAKTAFLWVIFVLNRWVAAQSIFYHLYNQVSYASLDEISPLALSIGNTMKRISVIVSSIIIFLTPANLSMLLELQSLYLELS